MRSIAAHALAAPDSGDYLAADAIPTIPVENAAMSAYGKNYDTGVGSEG